MGLLTDAVQPPHGFRWATPIGIPIGVMMGIYLISLVTCLFYRRRKNKRHPRKKLNDRQGDERRAMLAAQRDRQRQRSLNEQSDDPSADRHPSVSSTDTCRTLTDEDVQKPDIAMVTGKTPKMSGGRTPSHTALLLECGQGRRPSHPDIFVGYREGRRPSHPDLFMDTLPPRRPSQPDLFMETLPPRRPSQPDLFIETFPPRRRPSRPDLYAEVSPKRKPSQPDSFIDGLPATEVGKAL